MNNMRWMSTMFNVGKRSGRLMNRFRKRRRNNWVAMSASVVALSVPALLGMVRMRNNKTMTQLGDEMKRMAERMTNNANVKSPLPNFEFAEELAPNNPNNKVNKQQQNAATQPAKTK
ncbi:hypothetical protein ACSVDA_01155 [Cytobacillus sp. Hm23]